jgi:hypothetical protein
MKLSRQRHDECVSEPALACMHVRLELLSDPGL